ncbi:hypothetical protein CR513_61405, partial [Mucuna pruriens]
IVVNGNCIPKEENGIYLPRSKWNENQRIRYLLNLKARNFITCVLTKAEYEKVIALQVSKNLKKLSMEELICTLKKDPYHVEEERRIKMEELLKKCSPRRPKIKVKCLKNALSVCYECKKLGHFKSKCPSLEKEKKKFFFKKKKGFMARWEDLDLFTFEEDDEKANICFTVDVSWKHRKILIYLPLRKKMKKLTYVS